MSETEEIVAEFQRMAAEGLIPVTTGPALYYVASDGRTVHRIDMGLITDQYDGDATDVNHRERLICRALITHALALLDGEDVA